MLIELNPVPEIVSVVALDIKGDVLEVTTSGTTVATVTFVTIAATPLAVIVARSNPALALTRFVSWTVIDFAAAAVTTPVGGVPALENTIVFKLGV